MQQLIMTWSVNAAGQDRVQDMEDVTKETIRHGLFMYSGS